MWRHNSALWWDIKLPAHTNTHTHSVDVLFIKKKTFFRFDLLGGALNVSILLIFLVVFFNERDAHAFQVMISDRSDRLVTLV